MRPLLPILSLALLACSRGEFAGVAGAGTTAGDTVTVALGTTIGKLKAGNVIFQNGGAGNVANANDDRKAGQKGSAAATAPNATACATTTKAPLPWWVFALVGVLSIAIWEWATRRLIPVAWLPWRVRPA